MTQQHSGFSKNTYPDLYNKNIFGSSYNIAQKAYVPITKQSYPARDNRYPAYTGQMEDGRFITDYRPQCSKNIETGNQYNTKLWLINHSDYIINESRKRQVELTGASLAMANTVPPPANIVHSNAFYSEIQPSGYSSGIGVERSNNSTPDLFGTFKYAPTMTEIQNNRKNISFTSTYEGGRNTPRGSSILS